MNLKKIVLLVFILTVLIVGIILVEKKEEKKAKREGLLVELEPEQVKRIEIIRGAEKICFEKKDNSWSMTTPLEVKADKVQIENIVDEFSKLRFDREVEADASDVSRYGLDKPVLMLKLFASGQESPLIEYQIGLKNNFDNSYYLKSSLNNRVVLIAEYKKNYLSKDVQDYRDKKFFTVNTDSLKKINLKREKDLIEFEKIAAKWWLTTPLKSLAAQHRMEDLFFKLNNLEAKTYREKVSEQILKSYDFLNKATLTITLQGDNEQKLYLLKKEDQLLCYTPEFKEICEIDKDFLTPFAIELKDFRENKVLRFKPFEIEKVVINREKLKITLTKDEKGNWSADDKKLKISSEKVNNLLSELNGWHVSGYEDQPEKHNFDLEIKLFNKKIDQQADYSIAIASAEKENCTIKVNDLPYYLQIESNKLTQIPTTIEDLIEKEKKEPAD